MPQNENLEKEKMKYVIKWVVSPYRKDKRTGAINPVPMSSYARYLRDQEIKRIRG